MSSAIAVRIGQRRRSDTDEAQGEGSGARVGVVFPRSRVVTPLDAVDTRIGGGSAGALCGRGIVSPVELGTARDDEDDDKYASVCGVVMRVDRLTWVQHPRGRYAPKVGDVVVGVVREIVAHRMGWRVDVNASRDAMLMLAAMSDASASAQQRRLNADDANALQLSRVLREGECVSCEVQQASHGEGGSVALHTRSSKYGRLDRGQLVRVPCALVRRMKQHFHYMDCGVTLIIGCNGYIWVGCPHTTRSRRRDAGRHTEGDAMNAGGGGGSTELDSKEEEQEEVAARRTEARVAAAVRRLVEKEEQLYPAAIAQEMTVAATELL